VNESYFLAVKRRTPSRLWVNNPTISEVQGALQQGAVGCTTNPSYGANLIARAPREVMPIVTECAAQAGEARAAAHLFQRHLVGRVARQFRALYDASDGREGFVSIQGAPDEDEDGDAILAQGREARRIGPNIAVKIPATPPGFFAFEHLVLEQAPTIITEVFSLAQVVYACELYLKATAITGVRSPFFMSPITGIFGDHLRTVAARDGIACSPALTAWAGVALARASYAVVESRSYPVTLLFGGARSPVDFTGLIGGRSAATINYSTLTDILALDPPIDDSIHAPVDADVLETLKDTFVDFARALALDGLSPEEFEHFGPVIHFRNTFLDGWRKVLSACEAALTAA
jgi:transaldolase